MAVNEAIPRESSELVTSKKVMNLLRDAELSRKEKIKNKEKRESEQKR